MPGEESPTAIQQGVAQDSTKLIAARARASKTAGARAAAPREERFPRYKISLCHFYRDGKCRNGGETKTGYDAIVLCAVMSFALTRTGFLTRPTLQRCAIMRTE